MRIKVEEADLENAVHQLIGIDVLVKDVEEARRVLDLLIRHTETSRSKNFEGLESFEITESLEYPTTSVEYKRFYEIEFKLQDDSYIDMEIELIRELQKMFRP